MQICSRRIAGSAALAVVAIAVALAPSSASAVITGSNITSPANETLMFYDDIAPSTFAISGTTTGAGNVDIRCYGPDGDLIGPPATNVPVVAGTFSIPNAPLANLTTDTCRLRATPAGIDPPDPSPFGGPIISTSTRQEYRFSAGPNTGKLYDFYISSVLPAAGADFESIGSCGLYDSYLTDATLETYAIFYCNDYLPLLVNGTQPSITVDGVPAYSPQAVHQGDGAGPSSFFTGFENIQPLPELAYNFSLNPVNRDLTINESDRFGKCAPNPATFKPTALSCTSLADAGIKVDRTIVADHGQKQARFTDHWSSTNGQPHTLSLQLENDQSLDSSANVGFKFPGQPGYSPHADNDSIGGPFPGVASAYVKDTAVGDGPPGQGAITWSRAPDSILFDLQGLPARTDFFTNYANLTVPANGTLDLQFAYSTAFSTAEVNSLAREAEDRFSVPTVALTSPANKSNTTKAKVTVKGTASDLVGVSSLNINGKGVALGAGGSFAGDVSVKPGANTITAIAKDAFGNAGQAQLALNSLALKRKGKARAKRRGGSIEINSGYEFICPAGGATCKLNVSGKSKVSTATARKKNAAIGKSKLTVKPGKAKAVKLKLNRKGAKALKRAGKLKIKLTASVKIGKTKAGKVSQTFTVRKPRG